MAPARDASQEFCLASLLNGSNHCGYSRHRDERYRPHRRRPCASSIRRPVLFVLHRCKISNAKLCSRSGVRAGGIPRYHARKASPYWIRPDEHSYWTFGHADSLDRTAVELGALLRIRRSDMRSLAVTYGLLWPANRSNC